MKELEKSLKRILSELPVPIRTNFYKGYRKYLKPDINKRLLILRQTIDKNGYSLKGYDELKCIFVRTPKCASQSIAKALFGNLGGGHKCIDDYRYIFSAKEFNEYFKFTFVRNPWDRVVSAYLYHKEHWPISVFGAYSDFNSFAIDWLSEQNIYSRAAFKPQYEFICDKAYKVEVDFIGHVENIEEDFLKVTHQLGIDRTLSIKNKTNIKTTDYRSYYNDKSAQLIADLYKKDIELFGYDFDNSAFQDVK